VPPLAPKGWGMGVRGIKDCEGQGGAGASPPNSVLPKLCAGKWWWWWWW